MTILEEKILKNRIKRIVRESIFDIMNGGLSEKESKEDNDSHEDDTDSKHGQMRKRVIQALKDPTVDVAQYAYRLWPKKDKDSSRSYFYKCLDGKKNDDGDPYSFSDDEIIRLHSMLTDTNIDTV